MNDLIERLLSYPDSVLLRLESIQERSIGIRGVVRDRYIVLQWFLRNVHVEGLVDKLPNHDQQRSFCDEHEAQRQKRCEPGRRGSLGQAPEISTKAVIVAPDQVAGSNKVERESDKSDDRSQRARQGRNALELFEKDISRLGCSSRGCCSCRITPLLLGLHSLYLDLVIVPPQVYSRLCCCQDVKEITQVKRPLVQSESLVHAARLDEVEPVLGTPRPDIRLYKHHRGERVGDERDECRRTEEVLCERFRSGLCLAPANMPLSNAEDVDGKGGEED